MGRLWAILRRVFWGKSEFEEGNLLSHEIGTWGTLNIERGTLNVEVKRERRGSEEDGEDGEDGERWRRMMGGGFRSDCQ